MRASGMKEDMNRRVKDALEAVKDEQSRNTNSGPWL